jgi:hypothetical protein
MTTVGLPEVWEGYWYLWWGDADGVGAAGADGTAGFGVELFVEAHLDCSEVVVAATEG